MTYIKKMHLKRDQWWLYVLKCNDNCWYVGITKDIDRRFDQHVGGERGSDWTRLHKPIEIDSKRIISGFDSQEEAEDNEETPLTLKLMKKYGVDKVRGGTFSNIILNHEQKAEINELFVHKLCVRCREVKWTPNHRC